MIQKTLNASMLIAYNSEKSPLWLVDNTPVMSGAFGFPVKGKSVMPGGVLFRNLIMGKVLGSDNRTIKKNLRNEVLNQIGSAYNRLI